jgi:hypothetical protein
MRPVAKSASSNNKHEGGWWRKVLAMLDTRLVSSVNYDDFADS